MEQPTRTLLSFLISSVAGKYDDLVCFVPVVTLDSDLLKQHHKQVVEGLEKIGYKTLITITDNHKTNRKFFSSFANGDLLPQVPHPICSKRPHFLLFDPVHIMKNFYNNFQKKKWVSIFGIFRVQKFCTNIYLVLLTICINYSRIIKYAIF